MGPLLLARMLELNDTQEGVLNIAFKLADDQGLLLLDFKDLTAILQAVAEGADQLTTSYGNVSKATIGTIQRRLLTLEQQGAEHFFGEPALELSDLMLTTPDGRGAVNVLVADKLIQSPRLYATFLLWLLSELFEELPEAGDLDKPKLVFFFDEAHLLFNDAPKALTEKVEQVVRLIRSKGVGVYFVTQNPADVPPVILGQLGNRVQHALRAFTPAEQKGIKAAAETFRPNPAFKTQDVITQLGVGEALVSTLDLGGVPGIVERAKVIPPRSRMGPITPEERQQIMTASPVGSKYAEAVDREFGLRDPAAPRQHGGGGGRAGQSVGRGHGRGAGRHRQSVGRAPAQRVRRRAGSAVRAAARPAGGGHAHRAPRRQPPAGSATCSAAFSAVGAAGARVPPKPWSSRPCAASAPTSGARSATPSSAACWARCSNGDGAATNRCAEEFARLTRLSFPKEQVRILLLEGIHENAVADLAADGYTGVDRAAERARRG